MKNICSLLFSVLVFGACSPKNQPFRNIKLVAIMAEDVLYVLISLLQNSSSTPPRNNSSFNMLAADLRPILVADGYFVAIG